jgi:integrase-like protein
MEKAVAAGQGKRVYRDYIQAIDNYLIPFFGRHHVDRITYPLIQEFEAWRIDKMGRQPKASTINNHNSALSRIFDEALMRGYIAKTQIPVLSNKGQDAQRRPDFTIDEYRKMTRALPGWIRKGRAGKSRDMRELLRDYILILANTGMRHGTETGTTPGNHEIGPKPRLCDSPRFTPRSMERPARSGRITWRLRRLSKNTASVRRTGYSTSAW